jgi:hypothetical protein
VLKTGLPIEIAFGPMATVFLSTVKAEAFIVHSVGPYKLIKLHCGIDSRHSIANFLESISPPLKICFSELQSCHPVVSINA